MDSEFAKPISLGNINNNTAIRFKREHMNKTTLQGASGKNMKKSQMSLSPSRSRKLLNNSSAKSLGNRSSLGRKKNSKSHHITNVIKEKGERRGIKTLNTTPSKPTMLPKQNIFAAKMEATARLHHQTQVAPERHRKVYSEVFSAYLTPNSLSFLTQRGVTKASVS